MDIRDSIRKRIKEAQEGKKHTPVVRQGKWDPDIQPNIYELDNFLRKSGYRLIEIIEHKEANPELIIEAIDKDYLHPDITHDSKENLFYAKVVEHGMLVASDLEEIIKGYTTAQGVLSHLMEIDLDELEINIEEEE